MGRAALPIQHHLLLAVDSKMWNTAASTPAESRHRIPDSATHPTMKPLSFSTAILALGLATGCQTSPEPEKKTTPESAPMSAHGSPSAAAEAHPDRITTASGLQYRVLVSGPATGRSPNRSDAVTVHYIGKLTDGTVFDSSVERGQPATFGVAQVIPGWTEALQLMKPGDQWVLYIPARLAYGNRAVGSKIPPNSNLVFQVALIQVGTGF